MAAQPTFGTLSEYQAETKSFSMYVERVKIFFVANDVAEDKQLPVFLSFIGAKNFTQPCDLMASEKPQSQTLAQVTEVLEKHFEPKPLVTAERFHFHRQNQQSTETVTVHCNFGDHLNNVFRDHLVRGLRSESKQRRLLSMKDLTLKYALETAQAMEAADKSAKTLHGSESTAVNQIKVIKYITTNPRLLGHCKVKLLNNFCESVDNKSPQLYRSKMATRVLAVLIASFWFAVFVEKSWIFCGESHWHSYEDSFKSSESFTTCLLLRYPSVRVYSHMARSRKQATEAVRILQRLSQRNNKLLLRSGDLEQNPGPCAAATTSTEPQIPNAIQKGEKTLRFVHLNTRSLVHHFDDFACLVSSIHPEVLALSETWLDSSVVDCELRLPGYSVFRCDRSRCGGGVTVYCANHLSCSVLSCGASSSGIEYLWLSIDTKPFSSPLAFGCFYRLPSLPSQSVQNLFTNIESMMTS